MFFYLSRPKKADIIQKVINKKIKICHLPLSFFSFALILESILNTIFSPKKDSISYKWLENLSPELGLNFCTVLISIKILYCQET